MRIIGENVASKKNVAPGSDGKHGLFSNNCFIKVLSAISRGSRVRWKERGERELLKSSLAVLVTTL